MTMSENRNARTVAQLGAKLDNAVADGQEWDTLESLVRSVARAFSDDLATTMMKAHQELQPRPTPAVLAFADGFITEQTGKLASTIRTTLKRSGAISIFELMEAEELALNVVHARLAEVFGAASLVAGRA